MLTLFVGLLGSQALSACQKHSEPAASQPAASGLNWDQSRSHVFELELSTLAQLGATPAASPLVLRSSLELSFRGGASGRQVLLQLRDPQLLDSSGKPAADTTAFVAELAKPFAVELMHGVVKAYFEPASAAAPVVGFRRHIAATLQLAEHAGKTSAWKGHEWDATGLSNVEYHQVSGSTWDWTKLGYERLVVNERRAAQSLDTSKVMPKVEHATGRIVTDGDGVVSSLRDETISVPLSGTTSLTTQLKLGLKRTGFGAVATTAAWEQQLKALTRVEVGSPAPVADPALLDQARIGSHTFDEVVTSLSQLEKKSPSAPATAVGPLFHALVGIFRQQPETIDAAIRLIRARTPITDTLLDALAMASSPASLAAVAKLALDPAAPEAVRLRAVGSFIRGHEPEPGTLDLAIKMLDEALLRENALYGIGSFVRQFRDHGQTAAAQAGAKVLARELSSAKTPGDRATVLLAISNSGSPALFDAAVSYQKDPNATLRQAAIEAVRLMPQPEVEVQLREVLSRHDRGDVLAALHGLGRRPQATRESVDRVQSIAKNDPSADIRREAVLVLGLWSQVWPALVPVLADIRANDKDERVREVAKPVASP